MPSNAQPNPSCLCSLRLSYSSSTILRAWLPISRQPYHSARRAVSSTARSKQHNISTIATRPKKVVSVSTSPERISKCAFRQLKPSWGSQSSQIQKSTQKASGPVPKTLDTSADPQTTSYVPLRAEALPHDSRIELYSSYLVKSGKETRIQEDRELGIFQIQHILDTRIKPGLFLARREPKNRDPTYGESFILAPFDVQSAPKWSGSKNQSTTTVKLGLVSSPLHLQKALEDCFQLLEVGDRWGFKRVNVKVVVNKKHKKSKVEKLDVDLLARNPHVWPDVVVKCMPKGSVCGDVMINHEEGVVSWVMKRE